MWDRIGATVLFITILTVLPGLTVLARREGAATSTIAHTPTTTTMICAISWGRPRSRFWYCKTGDVRHPQDKLCAKDPKCKVYGLSPSSTIPFVATVSGLCCAVLMPLVGAFVDHSPKRWEALVATAALLIAANALQISLGPRTWFCRGPDSGHRWVQAAIWRTRLACLRTFRKWSPTRARYRASRAC